MTIIIKHRINAIRDLLNTPQQFGVEIISAQTMVT